MKKINYRILLPFLLVMPSLNLQAELTLDSYLKEVEVGNQTIQSSKLASEGLTQRQNEANLIFQPSIYAQGQALVDKKPTTSVNAQGDQTDNTMGTVGLMQQFDIGLKGKLGYTLSHTKIYNASAAFLPVSNFNDSQIALELTQSLWRNFYGIEGKSQTNLLRSDVVAKKLIESYKVKSILSGAESVYWSLSQLNKMLTVQKDSLARAIKIKQWAQNRMNSGLGDKSDLLQAEANLTIKEYELKTIEQQLKNTARSFNSLRGIDSEFVNTNLNTIDTNSIKKLVLASKSPLRDDTKAAIEYEKMAKANLDLSIEKNKPTFEVYGSYALNGRNPETSQAISNGFKTDHSTAAVGIRFQVPLNFSNLSENISGYKKEQNSAALTLKQKLFDQEREWNDLISKFEDAKNNLVFAEKIEDSQKIKSTNERDRLAKGRTTTFQALNFEQDYAQSELLRIKSELEVLSLYAQAKTFMDGGSL